MERRWPPTRSNHPYQGEARYFHLHQPQAWPAEQVRLAAVCVLDFKARAVGTRDERGSLCELYLRRHDRIDTWGMVDRAAPWVVGGSIDGHDLSVLHRLAASPRPIERRSAITAPLYFAKFGDDDEVHRSFEIANQLAQDPETVVHKAVGIFIKHAGRRLPDQQRTFLETHAATMARPGLRLAIANLEPSERQRHLNAYSTNCMSHQNYSAKESAPPS